MKLKANRTRQGLEENLTKNIVNLENQGPKINLKIP